MMNTKQLIISYQIKLLFEFIISNAGNDLIPLTRSIVKCKLIRDELMEFLLGDIQKC